MAQINFPAASESPWYNSDNGVTYEYVDGVWRTVTTDSPLDDIYVKEVGDTMTGALYLHADPTSDLEAATKQYVDTQITTNENGETGRLDPRYLIKNDSSALNQTVQSTGTTTFNGSATFAGVIKPDAVVSTRGVYANSNGTDEIFVANTKIGGVTTKVWQVDGPGHQYIGGIIGSSPNISLMTDGSAEFAGNVVSSASNFSTAGCQLGQNGGISARRVIGSDLPLFQGWNGSTSTVAIFQSGNAEFAGDVETKTGFTLKGGAVSHRIGTGTYWHTSVATSKYIISTGVAPLGDTIATFTPDGNLELKGNVTFNLEPDNNANYTVTTEEYEEEEELTPYVPAVEEVVGPLGNVLVAGVPAVEATYQTVTKTREIRTYTGPTLDVKERLQNLISRIDAIEANEVVDDATDSSLLQLVASLTTRLDERDAQIAALTARVTTLES